MLYVRQAADGVVAATGNGSLPLKVIDGNNNDSVVVSYHS